MTELPQIRWPERYDPRRAPIFVSNERVIAASPAAIWAWLVHAPLWPTYYANSSKVVLDVGAAALTAGTTFRWRTFGVSLVSRVEEFVPAERIAWTARGTGVEAYHAWLLTPVADGCRVLTEETQYGWLARAGRLLLPNRMHTQHQRWLDALAGQAMGGSPDSSS